jgi:hypothetical protein
MSRMMSAPTINGLNKGPFSLDSGRQLLSAGWLGHSQRTRQRLVRTLLGRTARLALSTVSAGCVGLVTRSRPGGLAPLLYQKSLALPS